MTRVILAASVLASLTLPALAASSPSLPSSGCTDLAAARSQARAVAAPQGYRVVDMDGEAARSFQAQQGSPLGVIADHLTLMTNPKTGRSIALINDGPRCSFRSVGEVVSSPANPIASSLDLLRAR